MRQHNIDFQKVYGHMIDMMCSIIVVYGINNRTFSIVLPCFSLKILIIVLKKNTSLSHNHAPQIGESLNEQKASVGISFYLNN